MNIEYKYNTASENELYTHLLSVDNDFVVPLSKRVNINEYTKKIFEKAVCLEAWSEQQLIGLVAYYFNEKQFFITNVSVLAMYSKNGIATILLNHVKNDAVKKEVCEVIVETEEPLILFYQKQGFHISDRHSNQNIKMIYKCK